MVQGKVQNRLTSYVEAVKSNYRDAWNNVAEAVKQSTEGDLRGLHDWNMIMVCTRESL